MFKHLLLIALIFVFLGAAEKVPLVNDAHKDGIPVLYYISAPEMTVKYNQKGNLELVIDKNDLDLVMFSDRPRHLSKHVDMNKLKESWESENDGFAMNHPNAVLTINDDDRFVCMLVER